MVVQYRKKVLEVNNKDQEVSGLCMDGSGRSGNLHNKLFVPLFVEN